MKTFLAFALTLLVALAAPNARAQENAWVQIEALRTLADAETRARAYANAFPNVNGFRAPGGWYAIALGPYTQDGASAELQALKRERLIPSDSFMTFTRQYRQQFWPIGADTLNAAPGTPQADQIVRRAPAGQQLPDAAPGDETPREARASEAALDPEVRRLLQEALQWEGFYSAAIDGSFGRGTRAAMAAWQNANGHEPTGVLTTRQRAQLVDGYRSVFSELGLETVRDTQAGIEMILPMGRVAHSRTEAPFIHYGPRDDSDVRVVLISQSGDEATLFGLYDVMQTLEIVPPVGDRERRRDSFVLTGQSATLNSHTYARLADGAVKGFTLAWPPERDKVMQRAVQQMRNSFQPLPGIVLPDTAMSDAGANQSIDLLAGLQIRRPDVSRTGFFVTSAGAVLTTTEVLGQCRRLTIGGEEIDAEVAARNDALGIALLEPNRSLTPIAVAEFRNGAPRLKSEVALAGFPYGDALDLPVMTWGTLADIRGLDGEDGLDRLALEARPGDAGGPVFDQSGAVLGMLRPRDDTGASSLPPNVAFAVDGTAIAGFLASAGRSPQPANGAARLDPEDLTRIAGDVAVRVSCWN